MEVANERYFKQDSRLPGKNTSNEQRNDDRNNREIQDKGTMSRISSMDSKTESRNYQRRNNVNKSETNNEELAQTSSFSLPNNVDYKDNLKVYTTVKKMQIILHLLFCSKVTLFY